MENKKIPMQTMVTVKQLARLVSICEECDIPVKSKSSMLTVIIEYFLNNYKGGKHFDFSDDAQEFLNSHGLGIAAKESNLWEKL